MNRRDFLKSLAAATSLSVLPAAQIAEQIGKWLSDGRIIGQTFYLTKTLTLDLPDGFLIDRCIFKAIAPFNGPVVEIVAGNHGMITNTIIECFQGWSPAEQSGIKVYRQEHLVIKS